MATKSIKDSNKFTPLQKGALSFLQQTDKACVFSSEIADALGTTAKAINPVLTALCKREVLDKKDGEETITNSKGTEETVTHKCYFLTEKGRNVTFTAEEE